MATEDNFHFSYTTQNFMLRWVRQVKKSGDDANYSSKNTKVRLTLGFIQETVNLLAKLTHYHPFLYQLSMCAKCTHYNSFLSYDYLRARTAQLCLVDSDSCIKTLCTILRVLVLVLLCLLIKSKTAKLTLTFCSKYLSFSETKNVIGYAIVCI